MTRTIIVACLLGAAGAATLKNSDGNRKGYCYSYGCGDDCKAHKNWCWLVHSNGRYVKEGDGGYRCSDYDGYSSGRYCKGAGARHRAAPAPKPAAAPAPAAASGGGNSPWAKYLASHTSASFNWIAACKSLGQTPSGYGSSSAGIDLTCDNNKIHITCTSSRCTSSYAPPASAGDTPPPGKYNVKAPARKCTHFSSKQVQDFLNIHNKMRCAVGAEPVHWDSDLECQAQQQQDKINKFQHSHCYQLPIEAGENIATGKSPESAAWMWFTEYLQSTDYAHGGETGHFSAMSWASVKTIGCGVGDGSNGRGVVRCQYASGSGTAPNMGGAYGNNLKKFVGTPAEFKRCGLTANEVKAKAALFRKWGILRPTGVMASNIGLYEENDSMWSNASPMALSAFAFIGAMSMVTIAVAVRRMRRPVQEDRELLAVEASEEGLE